MSASKLSDLLPIQVSDAEPNAYQVFGLEGGEHDASEVTAAIQRVYAGLKESKPTSDPAVWQQAARMVEKARKLLDDPERRQALDASLGIDSHAAYDRAASKVGGTTSSNEPVDPLAGLLPTASPIAPSASTAPSNQANNASSVLGVSAAPATSPASILGTPPLGTVPASTEAQQTVPAQPASPAVQVTTEQGSSLNWTPPKKKKTKRRKNNTGLFVLGVFVLLMIGAIIGLLQFLSQGGRIAINQNPMQDVNDDGVVVAEPMEIPDKPKRSTDSILGGAPTSGIADNLRSPDRETRPNTGSGIGKIAPPGPTTDPDNSGSMGMGMGNPNMAMKPKPPQPDPVPPNPPPPERTPAIVKANQAKIESAEQLILQANWANMKSAADGLLKLDLDPKQSERASTLFDIADLATYYRGAIERGLATLTTGATFEVVDNFNVIVVEVSADSLSIMFNKKTKTYSIEDLPPRLTEKIASFALSADKPDSIAGLALYRLIHPNTNADYRKEAFEKLASVDGELEKVDTKALQQVAKELFTE